MFGLFKRVLSDWRTVAMVVLGVTMVGVLLFLDRHHEISNRIQAWGFPGVLIAVVLMALWCLTPVPSEGLLVIFLRVFGVMWGTVYAWFGSMLSTLVIFYIARRFTRIWRARAEKHERFEQVNSWVTDWGSVGLLFARLLPVPAFVVNYAAGMIPTIPLWSYFWTAVVSIIPYYVGVALVFKGVSGHWIFVLLGVVPLTLVGAIGFFLRRRN